ncbi:polynucleotidyl transferase, ribonuclease H-like superfamily protein [Actinidia rufa]|uniref:Polynucleotidyl transferase, ribonuclease H-like superfamily protein n=1 Tax=Actinidia rufa TaxID=165716 RepID=A0A7J0G8T9_9ERIC|nr:polynucleotidyl transferase, ribonuclease H-like superfamily protein [Actinidia rufa]
MEAGYFEKVDELCDRYSLKGFVNVKEPETNLLHSRYLQLNELVLEDVIWVDEVNGLREATCHIEECKMVGIDCEWKPNYEKGSKPNKDCESSPLPFVRPRSLDCCLLELEPSCFYASGAYASGAPFRVSIMQIASEKVVFILDLIKLFEDVPDILDNCLTRILHSPRIIKLGYNFQCDVKQLAHSYGELKCFKHYEMLLDLQNVFREPRGGLSGLAQEISSKLTASEPCHFP